MAGGRRGRPGALACALGVLVLVAVADPGSGRGAKAQAPQPEAGFQVQADGLAAIEQGNVAAARERAIADALQRAVERATGTLLPAETLAQQDPLLRPRVYADAARYVQTYRIMTEAPAETLYQVSVEAVVAREPLRQTLVRLGLVAAGGPQAGPLGIVTVTARGATRQLHLATLATALVDRAQAQRVRYRSLAPGVVTLEVETPLSPLAVADELARVQVEGAHLTVSAPDGRRLEVIFTPAR